MDLAEEILGMTGMRTANGGFIRSHCTVETEYSNNNLVKYIQKAVPGWKVVAPPKANIAPSNFPNVDNQNSLNCAIKSLDQLLRMPISKCKDMISGHCETCGCIETEAVMAAIQNGDTHVLDIAHCTLAKVLEKSSTRKTSKIMFNPELRATQSPASRLFTMWSPLFNQAESLMKEIMVEKDDEKFHKTLTAGLPGVPEILHKVAIACNTVTDSSLVQVAPIAAVPLYVMNYIWDGDELNEKQLQETCHETALYSLHVVGVVFDSNTQTVYIADPNGPMKNGGNKEFLPLPTRKLPN